MTQKIESFKALLADKKSNQNSTKSVLEFGVALLLKFVDFRAGTVNRYLYEG